MRAMLSTFNTIVSTASAVVALWIAFQTADLKVAQERIATNQAEIKQKQEEIKTAQAELERRAKVEGLTHSFVDKVSAQLQLLKIDDSRQRDALIIDMIDMITLVNANPDGPGTLDSERRAAMSLRVALLAGNDETLAHIGGSATKRKAWIKLARASASASVRKTALAALASLARVADSKDIPGVVTDTLELADHLRKDDVLEAGLDAIESTVEVMTKEPARFREDEAVLTLIRDLQNLTVSESRTQAERHAESGPAAEKSEVGKGVQRSERLLARLQQRGLIETAAPASAHVSSASVETAIRSLASDKVEERRSARVELASSGSSSLPVLVARVRDAEGGPDAYRVKVGVASALFQMQQPVVITDENDAATIVALIGDPDPVVRKYTSEFLMKLSDADTVRRVHGALTKVLTGRTVETGTQVYNAVVVLGTWLRILPASQAEERAQIQRELSALRNQLTGKDDWRRTRSLVDELLRRASGSPVPRAPARS